MLSMSWVVTFCTSRTKTLPSNIANQTKIDAFDSPPSLFDWTGFKDSTVTPQIAGNPVPVDLS